MPWGAIDSAMAFVVPRRAAARYAGKVAIANLRRGCKAGGKTRITEGWRGSNASADAEIAAAGPVLRDRSRDLVRNNALAAQTVLVLVNNIVGPGIRPRAASGNKAMNKRVDALWRSFSASCDFYGHTDFHGLLNLAVREMVEAGDILALKITNACGGSRSCVLMRTHAEVLDKYQRYQIIVRGSLGASRKEPEALLQASLNRNASEAISILSEHIRSCVHHVLSLGEPNG